MQTYIAFQNKSYPQERMGNILYTANKCMEGYEENYYINLQKLQKGDIVYNISEDRISSVSFVLENAVQSKRPSFLEKTPWGDDGVVVNVQYHDLGRPIDMSPTLITNINNLCYEDKAPYTDSFSQRHGYIFKIPYTVHKLLVKRVLEFNNIEELRGKMLSDKDIELINTIENKLSELNTEDERKVLIEKEVLEKILKPKKIKLYNGCTLCQAQYMDLLSAVYIKPWDNCSVPQKLDLNNVILLCLNHKYLFENGLITFNDLGIIMISSKLDYTSFKPLNISMFTSINATKSEFEYIKWHRENIFIK